MTSDADQSDAILEPEDSLPARASTVLCPTLAGLDPQRRQEIEALVAQAEQYASAAQAEATVRAYGSDWRSFTAWADRYGLATLPCDPATCALYLTSLAVRGLKTSTVRRRAAAIARAHRLEGHPSPTTDPGVMNLLEGIARAHGSAPKKKVALLRDPLLEVVDRIDTTTTAGLRDRALLLLGFAVGLRRSELVALDVEDLTPSPDGIHVRIAKSKTDQQGVGYELLVLYANTPNPCPVRALRAWLDASEITSGPIFRRVTRSGKVTSPLSPQSVALIIKRRAAAAGLSPQDFAGHSLRSGYATQAARDGHRSNQIADVTRHRDERVLNGYIRAGRDPGDIARVL